MKRSKKFSDISLKERESNWTSTPSVGIPIYRAEKDKNCPSATVKQYNARNKHIATSISQRSLTSSQWVNKTLTTRYENISLQLFPSIKIDDTIGKDNIVEIEILQRIVIRENLLIELKTLIKNQTDLAIVMNEIIELIRAIRYQTVDIIEDIAMWLKSLQPNVRSFMYRGINYLIKIINDLDYLDQYDEIIEKFCFEFSYNPLAFRGGGELLTLKMFALERSNNNVSNINISSNSNIYSSYITDGGSVDGLETVRLRNCEKVISLEIERVEFEKKSMKHKPSDSNNTVYDSQKTLGSETSSLIVDDDDDHQLLITHSFKGNFLLFSVYLKVIIIY